MRTKFVDSSAEPYLAIDIDAESDYERLLLAEFVRKLAARGGAYRLVLKSTSKKMDTAGLDGVLIGLERIE
jgi:hypothetical protein